MTLGPSDLQPNDSCTVPIPRALLADLLENDATPGELLPPDVLIADDDDDAIPIDVDVE